MGFDRRFTLVLAAWVVALFVALVGFIQALAMDGLAAARILAGLVVIAMAAGLWRHIDRTNRSIARFVEALGHGDFATRFDGRGGAGFGALGDALSRAMRALQRGLDRSARETRYLEGRVDDM